MLNSAGPCLTDGARKGERLCGRQSRPAGYRAEGRRGRGRGITAVGAAQRLQSEPRAPVQSPEHGLALARAPLRVGVWEAGRSGRGRARPVVAPPPPALPPPVPCGPGSHFGKSFVMVVG